ncbi:MAG TPA: hypothetical protein VH684_21920 [Xanthobacteraceae bacterium]|jgi:hypothetical protein
MPAAETLIIQSRACINCHTFFGNGAYYGPDLRVSRPSERAPHSGSSTPRDNRRAKLVPG